MRNRALIVVGLLVAFSATACRVPGQDFDRPPTGTGDLAPGGTLRIAMTQPAGLDPIDAYEPNGQLLAPLVCETLVNLDPETGELRSGLAKRVQVSNDGRTVTIQLFDDIVGHDGEAFDAEDVRVSLTRLASPANASRLRALLQEVVGYGTLAEDLLGEGHHFLIGVQVLEPYSLQVNLSGKGGQAFLRALAHPALAPVSSEWVETDSRAAREWPRCAGPYQPAAAFRLGDQEIILERFQDYHGHNATYVGGGAQPDRIVITIVPDPESAVEAYLESRVDVARVPERLLDTVGAASSDLVSGAAPIAEFVGLPASSAGPFGNAQVRTALSLALDRDRINRVVFGGARTPADGFYPPSLGDYHREDACKGTVPASGNAAAAREMMPAGALEQLRGGPVTFTVNDDPPYERLATEVAEQWREVFGIDVEVRTLPWQEYQRSGSTGLGFDHPFRIAWSSNTTVPQPTTLDPSTYIEPLFHSSQTAIANWSRWSNRAFELVYEREARNQSRFGSRVDWFQQLEDILCQQMPIIPIAFGRTHWLVRQAIWRPARAVYLDTTGKIVLREMNR